MGDICGFQWLGLNGASCYCRKSRYHGGNHRDGNHYHMPNMRIGQPLEPLKTAQEGETVLPRRQRSYDLKYDVSVRMSSVPDNIVLAVFDREELKLAAGITLDTSEIDDLITMLAYYKTKLEEKP